MARNSLTLEALNRVRELGLLLSTSDLGVTLPHRDGKIKIGATARAGAPIFHITTNKPEPRLEVSMLSSVGREVFELVDIKYSMDDIRDVGTALMASKNFTSINWSVMQPSGSHGFVISEPVPFDPPLTPEIY